MAPVFTPFATVGDPLFTQRYGYLTDVITAEDGTEQRVQGRVVPTREVAYLARTLEPHKTGWADALITGSQATTFAIPLWPLGTYLQSAVTAGSGRTLTVDATANRFTSGGHAVLWSQEGRAEEVTITGLTGTTITADVTLAWP